MHRSNSIVHLSLIIFLLYGFFCGIIFPFYVQLFGIHFTSNFQFFIFFLSCVVVGTIMGFLCFLISKITVVRIIRLIAYELKDIAEGQGDLTRKIDIESSDEVGQLAFWLNAFVGRLDLMLGNTKTLASTMRENGIDFNVSLRHAGDILQAVFTSLGNIDQISENQVQAMNNAKDNLQKFTQNIGQVSEHSTILNDSFKDFTHYIQKQSNLTQEFLSSMDSLKHSLGDQNSGKTGDHSETNNDLFGVTIQFAKESTRSIDEQSQRFTRIEKLLEEIEDIAESTHLLSINASIEAARAGESGRGFTIVALQIRNLATNSGTLTSEIREQIEAIINVAKSSGTQLSDLRTVLNNRMENVITDLQQLSTAARDISNTIEIINSMQRKLKERVEDISLSFAENNIVRETLLKPMEELSNYTDKLRNSFSRISIGSDEIEKVTKNFFAQGAIVEKQAQELVKSMQDYQTSQDKARNINQLQLNQITAAETDLLGANGGKSFA